MKRLRCVIAVLAVSLLSTACMEAAEDAEDGRIWLAGDHHVHTEYSGGYDTSTDPPTFTEGGDGFYPIRTQVEQGKKYGLKWMVITDHGGPLHSVVQLEQGYPDFLNVREAFPDMLLFYGMELDTPGADHSTLMIPKIENEANMLYEIESRYSYYDAWPYDENRNTYEKMTEALEWMRQLEPAPIVIKNHPGRQSLKLGRWARDTPEMLRDWHDTAPSVAIGFEGAPGHQAAALLPDGSLQQDHARGAYHLFPTMGGYDQMTALVGGVWDSLLGEGRRWWITITSDSHMHYTEGNIDFWPGEYAKTYVKAYENYEDIMNQMRLGQMFTVTGDLISELEVTLKEAVNPSWFGRKASASAGMGGTLQVTQSGADVSVTIRFRIPDEPNGNGERPEVERVDLIMGEVTGPAFDRTAAENPTTKVIRRFTSDEWVKEGEYVSLTYTLENVTKDSYIRIRGTNTLELEPEPDVRGEDPWQDLWFYSNPVFIEVK